MARTGLERAAQRGERSLRIGELSRRTNVAVKTLRFYSDEGLLPPTGRTASGYRIYGDDAVVRLELIRSLREAGLGLDRIRAILGHELSLGDALRLQLNVVEAHLTTLRQVAAALRAALRSEPTEHDIRRLTMVTKLSHDQRKAMIETFYSRVFADAPVDPAWRRSMIDASTPYLPDDPTSEQLDAWIELATLLEDPSFIESMRQRAAQTWTAGMDGRAYKQTADDTVVAVRAAIARGDAPTSEVGKAIVDRTIAGYAAAMRREPDAAFRRFLREQSEGVDARGARYWQLLAIINGRDPGPEWPAAEWQWFVTASHHHYP